MTPQEYQALREGMGMTRADLAELLGITRQAIRYREIGRSKITKGAEQAIRTLAASRWNLKGRVRPAGTGEIDNERKNLI